jgi:hypothetical protein
LLAPFPVLSFGVGKRLATLLALVGVPLLWIGNCTTPDPPAGERLARQHCVGCHVFAEPDRLSKRVWRDEVLPLMGVFLGVPGSKVVDPSSVAVHPQLPLLSPEEWRAVTEWYVDLAPDTLVREPTAIEIGLPLFRSHQLAPTEGGSTTTLVRIDTDRRQILFADRRDSGGRLHRLNPLTGEEETTMLTQPITDITYVADTTYVTGIGDLVASEVAWGTVEALTDRHPRPILRDLHRPTASRYTDLDGDGDRDWLVAEFGKYGGKLGWYEATAGGSWVPHVLAARPGALALHATDFDGDGRTDWVVPFGQGDECISVFLNRGEGTFNERRLLNFPPTNGTVAIELADFNGDGREDILYCNGDNADYNHPDRKPYHGYTIYLREEDDIFTEAWQVPINGAYGARVADFDQDGDLDIASISYFPDLSGPPRESFVYFENVSGAGEKLSFRLATFPDFAAGRYLVLDAGDVDGDGDTDILLGSHTAFPGEERVEPAGADWYGAPPGVIWLENVLVE